MKRHFSFLAFAALAMDPLGFALENFDATGKWRTTDGGKPIDSSGVTPDGFQLQGPADLRRFLVSRPELFVNTVTTRLLTYALVYTPLKRVSTLNTVVGALPGAMPPLLGYAAVAGDVSGWGLYLFAGLFAWQFPHFMAIAYLYREDYARAGLRMLPAVEGGVGMAGRQAVAYALVLLPVSLLPVVRGEAGLVYAAGALVLGLAYLGASIAFALRPPNKGRAGARALLTTSLVYLPVLYATILVDPVVHFIRSN